MQALAACAPASRKRSKTQCANSAQGARYLGDILSGPPFSTDVEAWAADAAAAAAASGNTEWANASVKARIEEVMRAFKGRGYVATRRHSGERKTICESQMQALRVGFTDALQPRFHGPPPNSYYEFGTFLELRDASLVGHNEAKKAKGVGHVSNRSQKFTTAEVAAWSAKARAMVDSGTNPYGSYLAWIDINVSLAGNRSHQWDSCLWGQLDHKALGGGDGSKPTFTSGARLHCLRVNTLRKARSAQNNEALLVLVSHKNPDLCALGACGEKELYLHGKHGLSMPTCELDEWLSTNGYSRPVSVTPLSVDRCCEGGTMSSHGDLLKKYAELVGLRCIGGAVIALRNFTVQDKSGDPTVEAPAAARMNLHATSGENSKRDTSYGNEHAAATMGTFGYGTGANREGACAHHRVLHHYLGTEEGRRDIGILVSALLPEAEAAKRDAALFYPGNNVETQEFQYKEHFLTLDFLYTHALVTGLARRHNSEALIDKDAKTRLETSPLLQKLLHDILDLPQFLEMKARVLKAEEFDIALGASALMPESNLQTVAMTSAVMEQQFLQHMHRKEARADGGFAARAAAEPGCSSEALDDSGPPGLDVSQSWTRFETTVRPAAPPEPEPEPKPIPPAAAAPVVGPYSSPLPLPSDFYARTRKYPEMLLYYAETVLPLDVNQPGWREAWEPAQRRKAKEQLSTFYSGVNYMVYAADFDVDALTQVVRDFKATGKKLTSAHISAREYERKHEGAKERALRLLVDQWKEVRAAVLESARAPAAAAAAAAPPPPPTKFYLGIDPATKMGFARFDMAPDGRVATITGSSRKFKGETGAALNEALDHISAAVAGAKHVFYEEYHKSTGYRPTLANYCYRGVIEMACAKACVGYTSINPTSWPALSNSHGIGAATRDKDAYKAALEKRFGITVPDNATSDAVDAVCIALYGLSFEFGIRPERQSEPPVFKWE